ncbi:hypothetical protein OESDEN_06049 [Oesophagostomum dentatum]|uniref:Secreted protein n=1 Tax=Oesophagostomum dentatum TaxID=61180 RepID=A0A0B1T8Y2_OESDE|nr:hypothetical protein OESDEN_06049 [Oesophagostomum dentatum]
MLILLVILFPLLFHGLETANDSDAGNGGCDSSCTLNCSVLSRCVLVPTSSCPKATCISAIQFLFPVEPPPDSGPTAPS